MSDILSRIENLRVKMEQNGLKAWLIPGTDPHMSEYLPKAWAERAYISGFTGSMGFIVIMLDKAGLWTDSRYFLQGETQLKGTGITLFKKGVKGTPEPLEWVKEQLSTGDSVGINGLLFSANDVMQMQDVFMGKTIALKTEVDLLSHLRDDASEEIKPAILLDGIYSGESTSSKLTRLRSAYSGNWMAIYSSLDQIAWLYNIRGTDVTYNPVLISYAIVTANAAYLFVDENKITENVKAELNKSGVEIKAYNSLFEFIENQTSDVCYIVDASSINFAVYNAITQNNTIINTPSLVNTFKSIKNKTELDGFKKSMISDGVAMTRFLMWFEKAMDKGVDINEYEIGVQLKHFRSQQEGFMDESFCTIASFNENGAIVHYSPPAEGSAQILKNGILLFDSGGQYLYGTTDITRTISTGKVPQEAKDDFTHVLQGHIGLATAVFPEGTRGVQLDVLARNKMWKAGLDYGHGTGHGVGHFLNVHEGPQTIRKEGNNIPLEPGMVMTIEPGIYRLNCWGLRVENMVYIDKEMDSEFGSFLSFKNLTLFPIDLKLINMNLLSVDEIEWLNAYHSEVLQALSPLLEENEINWLKEKNTVDLSERHLHIISFDVPFPANYGGVIDVFNRIKSLSASGIKITLHAFVYNRPESDELLKYCEKVYYYKRKLNVLNFFSLKPFIVKTRQNKELLRNLLLDDYPILFEGMHCTAFLNHPKLQARTKLVRMHNIEHDYYLQLARADRNIFRKFYNLVESIKLKNHQKVLDSANAIVCISPNDFDFYNAMHANVEHIPSSHSTRKIESRTGYGDYILYHGKLSVPENENAVLYLVKNIFSKINTPFIITGMNPTQRLKRAIKKHAHISLIPNPDEEKMLELIQGAHINLLITFQATGLKLKLLKSLYNCRFCIVNSPMVDGTGLEHLCEIADTPEDIISDIEDVMPINFSDDHIRVRSENLMQMFDPLVNAEKWNKLLF